MICCREGGADARAPLPPVDARLTCNHLNHCVEQQRDYRLGLVEEEIDANDAHTESQYDVFGRLLRKIEDDGKVHQFEYWYEGDPTEQYVLIHRPDHTSDGLWRKVWIDGLGREWKSVREGGATRLTEYHEDSERISGQSLFVRFPGFHRSRSLSYRLSYFFVVCAVLVSLRGRGRRGSQNRILWYPSRGDPQGDIPEPVDLRG